jgi:hypothetical protein
LSFGVINIDQFNLVIFDVPQTEITGRRATGRQTGTLGFAVSGDARKLRYDPVRKIIEGELQGRVNVPGYIDPNPQPIGKPAKGEDAMFSSISQNARLKVIIHLTEDLRNLVGMENISQFDAKMQLDLSVDADQGNEIPGYEIEFEIVDSLVAVAWAHEFARRLCVQPVRIVSSELLPWPPYHIIPRYTGDGLSFGQPGANTQWNKADLTFNWNPWETVIDPSLWAFEEDEAATLLATVDDPDCVEVFFVDSFEPTVFWGGGGSFDSGLSSAKIISTDQNAEGGVDLTHLAHELGHSVSLCHPGDWWCEELEGMNPSSTGTLMCPSGFGNDNPTLNSSENESGVSNPLLTMSLKRVTPGPDCINDLDCGPCP